MGLSLRSSLARRNTGCLSSICSHSCLSASRFGHGVATQQLCRKQADMERIQVSVFKVLVCQTCGEYMIIKHRGRVRFPNCNSLFLFHKTVNNHTHFTLLSTPIKSFQSFMFRSSFLISPLILYTDLQVLSDSLFKLAETRPHSSVFHLFQNHLFRFTPLLWLFIYHTVKSADY